MQLLLSVQSENSPTKIAQKIAQKTTDIASILSNIYKGGSHKKMTIKEIKVELKRLKVKGLTGKKKGELLDMLHKATNI